MFIPYIAREDNTYDAGGYSNADVPKCGVLIARVLVRCRPRTYSEVVAPREPYSGNRAGELFDNTASDAQNFTTLSTHHYNTTPPAGHLSVHTHNFWH